MSPEIATQVLREYRRTFEPGPDDGAGGRTEPWSAISVLAFASDDAEAVLEFEAGWALTMQNLARGIREPLRPEEVRAYAESEQFRRSREVLRAQGDDRMVTGTPDDVVARLRALQSDAEADELVVVTPGLDRDRRIASYEAVAAAWPR